MWLGKDALAGVDTHPYFMFLHRYPPLDFALVDHSTHGRMDKPCQCDNSLSGMSARKSPVSMVMRERNNVVEGGRKETGGFRVLVLR